MYTEVNKTDKNVFKSHIRNLNTIQNELFQRTKSLAKSN